jgi:uncharacterized protein involved in cysteine biosynthesis
VFEGEILRLVIATIVGSIAVLAVIWLAIAALLLRLRLFDGTFLDGVARVALGLGAVFATLALFGAIAAAVASLFVDRVARAVERRDYPLLPPSRRARPGEAIIGALAFLAFDAAVNLLALPAYLVWGANLAVFLLVNGALLGREYFEIVALRRVDRATMLRLRKRWRWRVLLAGMAIALLSCVPIANLVTPILATAFMLHIFQTLPEIDQGLPRRSVR